MWHPHISNVWLLHRGLSNCDPEPACQLIVRKASFHFSFHKPIWKGQVQVWVLKIEAGDPVETPLLPHLLFRLIK